MITNDITLVDNNLINNKFAYKFFKDKTFRNGNIIACVAPVKLPNLNIESDQVISFLWEIPDITPIAGVCIQRIFSSIVGNILSTEKYLNTRVEIDEEKIIIHKEHTHGEIVQNKGQASINSLSFVNNTGICYLGIYVVAGEKTPAAAFSTNLKNSHIFPQDVIREFYGLMQSLFLSSFKV